MNEEFLDQASAVAFARLEKVGRDPRKLADPFRTVTTIYAAQGVIDNGGLQYFFESDWPGTPPYSMFSQAYRNIGASVEADAIDAAGLLFGFSNPERHARRRCKVLAGPRGKQIKEELDGKFRSDVWRLLAVYAQENAAAFSGDG